MKKILKIILTILLFSPLQKCSKTSDFDEKEQEQVEQDKDLENTTNLPFQVKWSINRTKEQTKNPFKSFLHASEIGLYYYNSVGNKGFCSLDKTNGKTLWNITDETIEPPIAIKKIGNYLWALAADINDPTLLKINHTNGNVLIERKSGVFPSGKSNNSWFGLRKQSTSLYKIDLKTGNDIKICDQYRIDIIRNFLIKDEKLLVMDVRKNSRSILSIDPNSCNLFWEVEENDIENYGHLNYYSFAVDIGSKILSVSIEYFITRSPNTGQAEYKYPANNTVEITQFLHKESKNLFLFHDKITGKVFAFDWVSKTMIWESQVQNRDIGQLFLVKERLFLYDKKNSIYELNLENGHTVSEIKTKKLLPFETATISYSVNRLEDFFGEEYFKISDDEIYYTTEKSTIISARLQ
ncbi:hypothetical protein [Maribacter sp.]|uniref:hypothetical protein n=1 Tax=Maribacter sp. TaxID=1897614 RepID=UPI0025C1AE3C|nr:hypothetical protein [Maribacter sp.]